MIVPSSTEDDILRELLDDYKSVERKAKKIAQSQLEKMGKYGNVKEGKVLSEYFRTKNGNKWHMTIACRAGKTKSWSHRQHCIVELGNGLRDVYYLRGCRYKPPYFVKIHTHAISRMRERFCPKDGKELESNPDVMLDKVAFHSSEQPVFQYLTPPHLAKKIERQKRGSKVGGLCLSRAAAFIGYRTDKGNYEFLTFLGTEQLVNSKKKYLFFFLKVIYSYVNPKAIADLNLNFNDRPLEDYFVAMEQQYPELKPYIEHVSEGMYPLYL